jgi:Ca2+-transporting ATPase
MLLGAVVYVPWVQRPFGTFDLSLGDWMLVSTLALSVVPVLDAVKAMVRLLWFGELA